MFAMWRYKVTLAENDFFEAANSINPVRLVYTTVHSLD